MIGSDKENQEMMVHSGEEISTEDIGTIKDLQFNLLNQYK